MKHLLLSVSFILSFVWCSQLRANDDVSKLVPAFSYGGEPVSIETLSVKIERGKSTEQYDSWIKTMKTPDGKLQIRFDGKTYKKYPVHEYTVRLTNLSDSEPTQVISSFQSLALTTAVPKGCRKVMIHSLLGSHCGPDDFDPVVTDLNQSSTCSLSSVSGRSSNEHLPFIELSFGPSDGHVFAIGWPGCWTAKFSRLHTGHNINVMLGMDRTNFKLLPKESILQPTIVVFNRTGKTRREFKTIIHRFIIQNKVPRDERGAIIPPILAVASGGGNKTPAMMLDILKYVKDNQLPFNTYWVDAGWYGPPHDVDLFGNCGPKWGKFRGDWRVNTKIHPTGTLLPIANGVHDAHMKFLLWFEPECIRASSPIMKDHPEFAHDELLDFGNPEARKWIQNIIYSMIESHKIDVYRQDFNIDPRWIWNKMDSDPERIGISEAKHIEGLLLFLDEMRQRFPNILQENCAGGGRRLDIEMISRAHTYCRSDYFVGRKPGDLAFILGQNATLNLMPYLPFQGCEFNCVPVNDDYAAFSILSSGVVITPSDFNGGIIRRKFDSSETRWFKKIFDVAARLQPFYLGDFYPLTDETSSDNTSWCGWQFDLPEAHSGFAIVFRRADAKEETNSFTLGNIDLNATYEVETYGESTKRISGKDLAHISVSLPPRSFRLMIYKIIEGSKPKSNDLVK